MTKILITGSMGQLGRAINNTISNNMDYDIYNTDIIEYTDLKLGNISKLDITNLNEVYNFFDTVKPNIIINCAAHTAVDLCETDQINAYRINVEGPKNLAFMAERFNSTLVQISTDYIFDGKASVPYTEEMIGNPLSIYAYTKYEAEKVVTNYCKKNFIIRTAWLYGEGKNFVNSMLKLMNTQNVIKVVNDQYGTPTSADEVARLINYLLTTDSFGIYHGTCEGSTNWYEFASKIFQLIGKDISVIPIETSEYPSAAIRPKYSVLENKRLNNETEFKFINWDEALQDYLMNLGPIK